MSSCNYEEAKKCVHDLMSLIRKATPRRQFNPTRYADLEVRLGYLDGKVVNRAVITLRSRGCGWVERGGGCTMCGHYAGMSRNGLISDKDLIAQFRRAYRRIDFSKTPIICVYCGGSVLNEKEVPDAALKEICRTIAENNYIKKVVLESRGEYFSKKCLSEIKSVLGSRSLVIALGLETINDKVRELSINKGMTLRQFEAYASIVKSVAELRAYVMIKPPFLTESEMISDAVASIKYIHDLGVEEIHLEPITIQEHTLTFFLWKCNLYRLPWLWSIIEIVRKTSPIRVYVSPFAHFPKAVIKPHNCQDCNGRVVHAILERYNRIFDAHVFGTLDCECKERWKRDLKKKAPSSLETRIIDSYSTVCKFIESAVKIREDLTALQEKNLGLPRNFAPKGKD